VVFSKNKDLASTAIDY